MSSGLKIRIPLRPHTLGATSSGASSSTRQDQSSEDVRNENLPKGKYISRNGNKRNPPEKWAETEVVFLEKCFETTRDPGRSLKSEWALVLTEKRLQILKASPDDKENLAKTWLSHYQRRLRNWFKNKKAKIRAEKKRRQRKEDEEYRDDSPESEEGQSDYRKPEDVPNSADEGVSRSKGMQDNEDDVDSQHSEVLQDDNMLDVQASPEKPSITFPISSARDELASSDFLEKYEPDVIQGAMLLMQLKYGKKVE